MITISPTVANKMLNALRDYIDATPSGSTAILRLYSGTMPTSLTGGDVLNSSVLATLLLAKPCAPDAADGKLTLSAITQDAAADGTGAATFFRIGHSPNPNDTAAGGVAILQGSVSATSGAGDLKLDKVEIATGTPVAVSSAVLSF